MAEVNQAATAGYSAAENIGKGVAVVQELTQTVDTYMVLFILHWKSAYTDAFVGLRGHTQWATWDISKFKVTLIRANPHAHSDAESC